MALEDYLEPEVAVTAVVTAAVFSPQARKLLRRGAVYGTAGVLIAGDVLSTVVRRFGSGMQQAGTLAANKVQKNGQPQEPAQEAGGQS